MLGGGVTGVAYFGSFGAAPSLGLYRRTTPEWGAEGGASVGMFLGLRGGMDVGPFDMVEGVRIDYRGGWDASREHALTVSVQLDVIGVAILGYAASALFRMRD